MEKTYPELSADIVPISVESLKVIEDLRKDHLLLCEELSVMEQIAAIPNSELRKVLLDRVSEVSDGQETLVNTNFLRMRARRRLDEVSFCHGMGFRELKAHLERSIVLGDCLLCEWFVRSEGGSVAL